jgi:hypothetical protein
VGVREGVVAVVVLRRGAGEVWVGVGKGLKTVVVVMSSKMRLGRKKGWWIKKDRVLPLGHRREG